MGTLLTTGCGTQSAHPNQINAFDGQTYDTLTTARASLLSLRSQIETRYPKYKSEFNTAASAYNTTESAYALFRSAPTSDQIALATQIGNVTVNIVALESAIQADLHVPAATTQQIQARAFHVRKHVLASQAANVSFTDIMTYLEIASSVAQAVPGAGPYAALASVVIQATTQAVTAIEAANGKPIDLSTLAAIQLIQ